MFPYVAQVRVYSQSYLTRQTEEEVGRHQKMDRPGLEFAMFQRALESRNMEETGCKVIRGAPTTLAI